MQTRIDLAILEHWGNTAEFTAAIKVPSGQKVYVGRAAEQSSKVETYNSSTKFVPGSELPGGVEQVFLDFKVPESWILK